MRQNVWPPDLVSFRHAQEELAAFEKRKQGSRRAGGAVIGGGKGATFKVYNL
jgi:hypothetical protein